MVAGYHKVSTAYYKEEHWKKSLISEEEMDNFTVLLSITIQKQAKRKKAN